MGERLIELHDVALGYDAQPYRPDEQEAARMRSDWERYRPGVPLEVVGTPMRDLGRPLLAHLREITADPEAVAARQQAVQVHPRIVGWAGGLAPAPEALGQRLVASHGLSPVAPAQRPIPEQPGKTRSLARRADHTMPGRGRAGHAQACSAARPACPS